MKLLIKCFQKICSPVENFIRAGLRIYRKSNFIKKYSKSSAKTALVGNYIFYAAATTLSAIKILMEDPLNELSNTGILLAGVGGLLQFVIKNISAVQKYNRAEAVTAINYHGSNPYMFRDNRYFFANLFHFSAAMTAFLQGFFVIGKMDEENKQHLFIQIVANMVSIFYSELLAHFYVGRNVKKMEREAVLTPAQIQVSASNIFFLENSRYIIAW